MLFATVALSLSACSEVNGIYTADGSIYGYVLYLDSLSNNQISTGKFEGALVQVFGRSLSTQTTSDGSYRLTGLPTNTSLTLSFSKPGFVQRMYFNQIIPSTETRTRNQLFMLAELVALRKYTPNLTLRPFEFPQFADSSKMLSIFTSRLIDSLPAGQEYSALSILYFSRTSNVRQDIPASYQYATKFIPTNSSSGIAEFPIYRDSLRAAGFLKNETIYAIAYTAGLYSANEYYIDNASGKKIYRGLSPFRSEVKSFVMP
ncbi:MAG: carboxypeptidase-like regulatory domain-containing protein [bacterium]